MSLVPYRHEGEFGQKLIDSYADIFPYISLLDFIVIAA